MVLILVVHFFNRLKINPKYSFHFMFFTNYFLRDYWLQIAKRTAEEPTGG